MSFTLSVPIKHIMLSGIMLSVVMLRVVAPLPVKNALAYFCLSTSDEEEKRFIALTPGQNIIKLFTAVIYKCS